MWRLAALFVHFLNSGMIRYLFPLAILISMNACSDRTTSSADATQKPNIIYIYADDLGYGEIEPYGQTKIKTPHLRRMADEGMKFTRHYTSTPVCAPARCALLTGLHTGHTRIRGNYEHGQFHDSEEGGQEPLPEGTVTIATLLKDAGYQTGAVGKWGLGMTGNSGHPNHHGFDYFYGYLDQKQAHNYYPTHLWENEQWDTLNNPYIYVHNMRPGADPNNVRAVEAFAKRDLKAGDEGFFEAYQGEDYAVDRMTAKAEKFIRENRERPFFLYLPYTIPHLSLQVPDEALEPYVGQWEEEPYHGDKGYTPHRYPRSAYAAMVTYLDTEVGKIFALLDSLGLDENTIVFFSSDNGPTFSAGVDTEFFNSAGGLRGRKMELYEGGIRMPMLVRWPGKIKAGSTTDHLSVQYDVMATLCDLVGVAAPDSTDGISFLPTLLGREGEQQQHDFLYFEYPENGGQVAVRMGKWKAVKTGLVREPGNSWQLYNLEEDPSEENDVAAAHPDVIAQADEITRREHRSTHIERWNFMDRVVE